MQCVRLQKAENQREKFDIDTVIARGSLWVLEQGNCIPGWYFRDIILTVMCRKEKPLSQGTDRPKNYWNNPGVRRKRDRLGVHLKGRNDKGDY